MHKSANKQRQTQSLLQGNMNTDSLITILHISDFHFSKRKQREQSVIVEALVRDLKTQCIGHRKPDLVFFTGDLVQAAGTDLHDEAYDFLIDKVSKATGCSDERIFITPGNHDVVQAEVLASSDKHSDWRSLISVQNHTDKFNDLYANGEFDDISKLKFHQFIELEKYIGGDERKKNRKLDKPFATVDFIEALNIDIVNFNTALLSTGGVKGFEKDDKLLLIPEYAMIEVANVLSEGSFRVFLSHHPFSALSEESSRYLEGEFSKHANLHLFGHMHDPQPRSTTGLKGNLVSNQAGAIFTARNSYYNGYSLITIDRSNNHTETLIRSYFKDRYAFDDGIDVVEGGKWYSSHDARQHFRKIAAPIDEQKLRDHLSGAALTLLLDEQASIGGDGNLHTRFVAPPLKRTFIQETVGDESKVQVETDILFDDLVKLDSNFILYGRAEYGRTTLLKELRHRLLSMSKTIHFPRLPILFDFGSINANADSVLKTCRGRADAPLPGHDVEAMLKLGHACVMIDDVHFSDTKRMKVLRDFISKFPKARYILSSPHSSATHLGAYVDPEVPVRFEFVELREFRRNDMRQLLERYEQCTDVEDWLDRLQKEFKEINLPFTAANGSILIEILAQKHNFTPINRSVLMEQFVDSTLQKAAVEQSRRETFDYTNKTDLLAHIAAWMAKEDNYIPTKENLRSEMKAYVDDRGLNVSLDDLLSEFLVARIFITKAEDKISFRYRGVLEYFIALRMTLDPHFKDWVMAEERYLRFVHEIQYYAGKHRNDAAMVELIGVRHASIMERVYEETGVIDLNLFDILDIPSDKNPNSIEDTVSGVLQMPLTKEEKDAELEIDSISDAEDRQEVFRPLAKDFGEKIILSLILYSGLVKNMELISDGQKRQHIKEILKGWSVMLASSITLAPKLARERRIRVNGVLYEVQAPQGMSTTTLLKQMMLYLPHIHIRMLSNSLGTEKLERQLTEPALDEAEEPKIFAMLRAGLVADLRLDATPGAIATLFNKFKHNKYLLWSSIVHVSELRRLNRVKAEHFAKLDLPLASAIAQLRGGPTSKIRSTTNIQLSKLKKERLLLKMQQDKKRH